MLAVKHHHPAENRRSPVRPTLGRIGTLRVDGGDASAIVILDLTREGCRLETDVILAKGGVIAVGIAGVGVTPARAVWRDEHGYGCEFLRPLARGAITAAFQATNVAALSPDVGPSSPPPEAAPATKWPPVVAAALIAGATAATWAALAFATFEVTG